MDVSTSTEDLPAAAAPAALHQADEPPPAVPADAGPQEAHIHIHLDLDTDAGMARARALLTGLFQTAGAALPTPVAAGAAPPPVSGVQASLPAPAAAPHPGPVVHAPAALPAPAAGPPPGPVVQAAMPVPAAAPLQGPVVQAALPAPATPEAAMNMFLQHPYQANLIQHLIQNGTPRRRPGRPSRADTELRNLLAAVQPQPMQPMQQQQPAQPVQARMTCRVCNQPRADSILRSCGHLVGRACVLPFVQLRPICPVSGCNQPTTFNDIIHFST